MKAPVCRETARPTATVSTSLVSSSTSAMVRRSKGTRRRASSATTAKMSSMVRLRFTALAISLMAARRSAWAFRSCSRLRAWVMSRMVVITLRRPWNSTDPARRLTRSVAPWRVRTRDSIRPEMAWLCSQRS